MIIKNVTLETVCGITSPLPKNERMEVAFAGKSNVGKSSMINALMNRKALARTSSQPGKTQTINFYNVNSEVYLVDLPGYGFAKISKEGREELRKMINDYIGKSEEMVLLFVLIDSRHDITRIDREFLRGLGENGIPFAIIFTKGDKRGPNALKAQIERNKEILSEEWEELPPMLASSAETGAGKQEILDFIQQYIN